MNKANLFNANERRLQRLRTEVLPDVELWILQGIAAPFAKELVLKDIQECEKKRESLMRLGVVGW